MTNLRLREIANPDVVTVLPDTTLEDALTHMELSRISCVVVVGIDYRPVGIYTEQDAVRLVADGTPPSSLTMTDVMSRPVRTMPGDADYHDAFQQMSHFGHRHMVVVDEDGRLAGIASESDFVRHLSLEYLAEQRTVAAAMRSDVLTLDAGASLAEASRLMADHNQGCLLALRGGRVAGILTERDMVHLARQGTDSQAVRLDAVMRSPVLDVSPETSLHEAVRRMEAGGIRRLAVIRKGRLEGLITRHDIARVLENRHVEVLMDTIREQQAALDQAQRQAADLALIRDQHIRLQVLMHAFDASANAMIITDAHGHIQWANSAFGRLSGYLPDEITGRTPGALLKSGQHDLAFYQQLWATILAGQVWHGDIINRRRSGELFHDEVTITPVRAGGNDITHFIAVMQDISPRKRMEEELRESQLLFSSVVEAVPAMIWMAGTDKGCTWFSESWLAFSGRSMEQELGFGWAEQVHPEDRPELVRRYEEAFDARRPFALEYRLMRHDGEYRWILDHARPRHDAAGQFAGYIGACLDVTAQKTLELELARMATTDTLTGLANRGHFLDQMALALARHQRHGNAAALIMLDLDNFKQVNDLRGHAAGDEALRHFAGLMREKARRIDLPGRLGGEEFAILLPDTRLDGALEYAERLRLALVADPPRIDGEAVPLTLSAGVTEFLGRDDSVDHALERADQALYRAKRLGRNRVEAGPD